MRNHHPHHATASSPLAAGYGWTRISPVFVGLADDRIVIDATVVDSLSTGPDAARRHAGTGPETAGGNATISDATTSAGLARGEPVTLAIAVPEELAAGADELVRVLGSADVVHVVRDDHGVALFLRHGRAWWLLETVDDTGTAA